MTPQRYQLSIGALVFLCALFTLPASMYAGQPTHTERWTSHHEIHATLNPTRHSLRVEDTITFPEHLLSEAKGQLDFLIHRSLQLSTPTTGATLTRQPGPQAVIPLDYYTLAIPAETQTVVLRYEGEIYHPLAEQGEEYARSFTETPGLISKQGIYLAGSTAWYPQFDDHLMTFTIDIELPETWNAVSQGKRTIFNDQNNMVQIRWESPQPQDEIFLIGGRFTEYSEQAGSVEVMAFLQTPD
ncbi:MAG TPA: signal protein PDZ, partial [Nitrospirales bacterium]|nr:signal protein PDZ [Nitrospirales bacterium]